MNDLKVFENPNLGKVRVVERNGEPWFVAVDVCRILELGNPRQAVAKLDADERMTVTSNDGHSGQRGGAQFLNIVNESGLYALVLGSRKPEAKAFKRWVTHEVLPAIRRTGRYEAPGAEGITPAMALEAAQVLSSCPPEVRFCVHKMLSDAGFNLAPLGLKPPHVPGKDERKPQFARWFDHECMQRYATSIDAAAALGTSDANICRWRTGQNFPQARLLNVIINNFGSMPEVMEE